jgi:hypothetical protein
MSDPSKPVLPRRKVLGLAATAAATGAAWSVLGIRPAFAATTRDCPAGSEFVPYVGTRFKFLSGATVTVLKLESATLLPAATTGSKSVQGEAYSLVFAPVSGPALGSATVTVTHPDLGRFLMFLGPTISRKGTRYEAVINHQSLAA